MVRNLSKYARYGVTTAWVIAGGWLAGATAGEVRRAWYVVPTPPEVIKDVTVRNVKDDEGRAGDVPHHVVQRRIPLAHQFL